MLFRSKEYWTPPDGRFFAHYVLHSSCNGKLDDISFSEEIEKYIFYKRLNAKRGDFVNVFKSSKDRLGLCLMSFDDYDEMVNKIVYLVRHGDYGRNGSLNEKGKEQIKATTTEIEQDLGSLEEITIFHSPIRRARESAQIMAEEMSLSTRLERRWDLSSESYNLSNVVAEIEDIGIIISHMPDLIGFMEERGVSLSYIGGGDYYKLKV